MEEQCEATEYSLIRDELPVFIGNSCEVFEEELFNILVGINRKIGVRKQRWKLRGRGGFNCKGRWVDKTYDFLH